MALYIPKQACRKGSIRVTEEMAAGREDVFLPCQFSNTCNADAHPETTGPELFYQMKSSGVMADVFVAGAGTGGPITGAGCFLKSMMEMPSKAP